MSHYDSSWSPTTLCDWDPTTLCVPIPQHKWRGINLEVAIWDHWWLFLYHKLVYTYNFSGLSKTFLTSSTVPEYEAQNRFSASRSSSPETGNMSRPQPGNTNFHLNFCLGKNLKSYCFLAIPVGLQSLWPNSVWCLSLSRSPEQGNIYRLALGFFAVWQFAVRKNVCFG